jgi:hypothetical protein
MRCPYPRCRRKVHFPTKTGLERHYESRTNHLSIQGANSLTIDSDIQCCEICVFCGQLFKEIRKFIRHTCRARQRARDNAKELYRKERCAQLKKYSAKKLARTLIKSKARTREKDRRLIGETPKINALELNKGKQRQGAHTAPTFCGKLPACSNYFW